MGGARWPLWVVTLTRALHPQEPRDPLQQNEPHLVRERERDTEICRDESGGLEGAQSIKALKEVKENIRKQPQSTKSSYTS